eukprot:1358897-Rhodomonas_salina.1
MSKPRQAQLTSRVRVHVLDCVGHWLCGVWRWLCRSASSAFAGTTAFDVRHRHRRPLLSDTGMKCS